jgi:Ca-activated chloride channel homolog
MTRTDLVGRTTDACQKHCPSLAMILCIDRSISMAGQKMTAAKTAACNSTKLLGNTDLVGIVAFDHECETTLQQVPDRSDIFSAISGLYARGSTDIRRALERSFACLAGTNTQSKHVILLSDGQSSPFGIPDLVKTMAAHGITVSTVGIGEDVNKHLLAMIAELGKGRCYHTNAAGDIPEIFTKETKKVVALVRTQRSEALEKFAEEYGEDL